MKLGNYKIKRLYGVTELTKIYQAQHKFTKKDVLIETSDHAPLSTTERVESLTEILGSLQHENILEVKGFASSGVRESVLFGPVIPQ